MTRRCSRREYLLRPDAWTNDIFAYCLAEAAKRYGIGLIAWVAMSNHYHAVLHDPRGRLPDFLEQFHKMVAKAMNARWQRAENFWSSEETCVTRLVTNHDIFDKVLYVLCNPVAADLVDRVQDWPGASSLDSLDGIQREHRRPRFFFRDDGVMPTSVTLESTLPPRITETETTESWWERVRNAVHARERRLREERLAAKRPLMGRKAVLKMRHTEAPNTPRQKRDVRPTIACKDPERRRLELSAFEAFRAKYAEARLRWIAGARRVLFPLGTFRLLAFGVRCAPASAAVTTA